MLYDSHTRPKSLVDEIMGIKTRLTFEDTENAPSSHLPKVADAVKRHSDPPASALNDSEFEIRMREIDAGLSHLQAFMSDKISAIKSVQFPSPPPAILPPTSWPSMDQPQHQSSSSSTSQLNDTTDRMVQRHLRKSSSSSHVKASNPAPQTPSHGTSSLPSDPHRHGNTSPYDYDIDNPSDRQWARQSLYTSSSPRTANTSLTTQEASRLLSTHLHHVDAHLARSTPPSAKRVAWADMKRNSPPSSSSSLAWAVSPLTSATVQLLPATLVYDLPAVLPSQPARLPLTFQQQGRPSASLRIAILFSLPRALSTSSLSLSSLIDMAHATTQETLTTDQLSRLFPPPFLSTLPSSSPASLLYCQLSPEKFHQLGSLTTWLQIISPATLSDDLPLDLHAHCLVIQDDARIIQMIPLVIRTLIEPQRLQLQSMTTLSFLGSSTKRSKHLDVYNGHRTHRVLLAPTLRAVHAKDSRLVAALFRIDPPQQTLPPLSHGVFSLLFHPEEAEDLVSFPLQEEDHRLVQATLEWTAGQSIAVQGILDSMPRKPLSQPASSSRVTSLRPLGLVDIFQLSTWSLVSPVVALGDRQILSLQVHHTGSRSRTMRALIRGGVDALHFDVLTWRNATEIPIHSDWTLHVVYQPKGVGAHASHLVLLDEDGNHLEIPLVGECEGAALALLSVSVSDPLLGNGEYEVLVRNEGRCDARYAVQLEGDALCCVPVHGVLKRHERAMIAVQRRSSASSESVPMTIHWTSLLWSSGEDSTHQGELTVTVPPISRRPGGNTPPQKTTTVMAPVLVKCFPRQLHFSEDNSTRHVVVSNLTTRRPLTLRWQSPLSSSQWAIEHDVTVGPGGFQTVPLTLSPEVVLSLYRARRDDVVLLHGVPALCLGELTLVDASMAPCGAITLYASHTLMQAPTRALHALSDDVMEGSSSEEPSMTSSESELRLEEAVSWVRVQASSPLTVPQTFARRTSRAFFVLDNTSAAVQRVFVLPLAPCQRQEATTLPLSDAHALLNARRALQVMSRAVFVLHSEEEEETGVKRPPQRSLSKDPLATESETAATLKVSLRPYEKRRVWVVFQPMAVGQYRQAFQVTVHARAATQRVGRLEVEGTAVDRQQYGRTSAK